MSNYQKIWLLIFFVKTHALAVFCLMTCPWKVKKDFFCCCFLWCLQTKLPFFLVWFFLLFHYGKILLFKSLFKLFFFCLDFPFLNFSFIIFQLKKFLGYNSWQWLFFLIGSGQIIATILTTFAILKSLFNHNMLMSSPFVINMTILIICRKNFKYQTTKELYLFIFLFFSNFHIVFVVWDFWLQTKWNLPFFAVNVVMLFLYFDRVCFYDSV